MTSRTKIAIICVMFLVSVLAAEVDKVEAKSNILYSVIEPVTCGICKATLGGMAYALLSENSIRFFENLIYYGCTLLFSKDQCTKVSAAYVGLLMRRFRVKTFEPNYFCQVQVPACDNKRNKYTVLEKQDYEKRILADKPDFIKDNNFINNLYKEINEDIEAGNDRETILMYHFSDLHWNINYTEGSNNNCGEIVCCRLVKYKRRWRQDDNKINRNSYFIEVHCGSQTKEDKLDQQHLLSVRTALN